MNWTVLPVTVRISMRCADGFGALLQSGNHAAATTATTQVFAMRFSPSCLTKRASAATSTTLVNDNLRRLVDVETRHWPSGAECLPDGHLLLSEFLMVLHDGDVRIGRAVCRLEVRTQHSVALVVPEGHHLVQPNARPPRRVRVDPAQHASDIVAPVLPLHAQGGCAGNAAGKLSVGARSVGVGVGGQRCRRK